jgi:hypothetical protein
MFDFGLRYELFCNIEVEFNVYIALLLGFSE